MEHNLLHAALGAARPGPGAGLGAALEPAPRRERPVPHRGLSAEPGANRRDYAGLVGHARSTGRPGEFRPARGRATLAWLGAQLRVVEASLDPDGALEPQRRGHADFPGRAEGYPGITARRGNDRRC